MTMLGAACGAGIGLGVLLIVLGVRGTQPRSRNRPTIQAVRTEPVLVQALVALVAATAVWGLTRWVVGAALAAVLVVVLPRAWQRARAERAHIGRIEGVAAWTEMIRDTLAAAAGLEQAITTTADTAPEAIRAEVGRLVRRLDRGERLVPTLRLLADDLANPAADLVVAALVTAAQKEARDLVPLLDSLARAARDEAELRLRVDASRARLRTAVRVVVGTLGLFGSGLVLLNPAYLEPYRTVEGQLVLLVVAAILTTGYWLMQQMARIRPPERVLTREPARGTAVTGGGP